MFNFLAGRPGSQAGGRLDGQAEGRADGHEGGQMGVCDTCVFVCAFPIPFLGAANPIDAFIQTGLAKHSLPVPPKADRRTLLRRATYNVTGLPPSEEETQNFLEDSSPDAWERVIDRLSNRNMG